MNDQVKEQARPHKKVQQRLQRGAAIGAKRQCRRGNRLEVALAHSQEKDLQEKVRLPLIVLISRNRSSRGSSCSRLLGPWTFGGSGFVAEHERRKKEQIEQHKPQGGKLPP